jgi:hypothetical protein
MVPVQNTHTHTHEFQAIQNQECWGDRWDLPGLPTFRNFLNFENRDHMVEIRGKVTAAQPPPCSTICPILSHVLFRIPKSSKNRAHNLPLTNLFRPVQALYGPQQLQDWAGPRDWTNLRTKACHDMGLCRIELRGCEYHQHAQQNPPDTSGVGSRGANLEPYQQIGESGPSYIVAPAASAPRCRHRWRPDVP